MDELNKASEASEADHREAQVKITSVEKAKDPKRVESGKKLGAMSRQAKEKKAAQRIEIDEFQIPSIDSVNPLAVVGVVGVVGVIVYYKYFRSSKDVVVDKSEKSENPVSVEQEKPKQRELDSLD